MPQIDIDFEVFKALTSRRDSEDVSYNDVIRCLLKLPAAKTKDSAKSEAWVVDGTSFPAGSEFVAEHKGTTYSGLVRNGRLELSDGKTFRTPSAAALHITGYNVNGWRFWTCKPPGASQFVKIERLRGRSN